MDTNEKGEKNVWTGEENFLTPAGGEEKFRVEWSVRGKILQVEKKHRGGNGWFPGKKVTVTGGGARHGSSLKKSWR